MKLSAGTRLEPDLCVMDVKMPKMDGITAAEEILQELSCAVVMLTSVLAD